MAFALDFAVGLAAGLAGAFAGATATAFLGSAFTGAAVIGFFGSALGAAALAFGASFKDLDATAAADFFAAGNGVDFLGVVTGTEELTFAIDFFVLALDAAAGVALTWALMGVSFALGLTPLAFATTFDLETGVVLLGAFTGVFFVNFLVVDALLFVVGLAAEAFLVGTLDFFAVGTAFALVLAEFFAVALTGFALLTAGAFLLGAGALFAAPLGLALTGFAAGFLATVWVLVGNAFFAGTAFLATGALVADFDALVFFGVGMVQPSLVKRIG